METNNSTNTAATGPITHEAFLHRVRDVVVSRLNAESAVRLRGAKLAYGSGVPGVRGTCFYRAWEHRDRHDFIEICAVSEESTVQLAGTTIHELAHCLAGPRAGHGIWWKRAAAILGLRVAMASNQEYHPDHFDNALWAELTNLPVPGDGRPSFDSTSAPPRQHKPCPAGIGTRGGTSRGQGSCRLRLYECQCDPPVEVRVARDPGTFHAQCLDCGTTFTKKGD